MVILLGAVVVLLLALRPCQPSAFLTCSITICITSPFVTGYALGMNAQWPWLHDFRRSEYADVRDALNSTPRNAEAAATSVADESTLRTSGAEVATRVAVATGMKKTDDVLEIGCGVGRVGWAMASLSRSGPVVTSPLKRRLTRVRAGFSNTRLEYHESLIAVIGVK